MQRERSLLYKEVGLDEQGRSKNPNEPIDKYADKIKKAMDKFYEDYDIDPSAFYVFSRDNMRVDVGLMIQRPPIFMLFRQRDIDFLKFKTNVMNEYYVNQR